MKRYNRFVTAQRHSPVCYYYEEEPAGYVQIIDRIIMDEYYVIPEEGLHESGIGHYEQCLCDRFRGF